MQYFHEAGSKSKPEVKVCLICLSCRLLADVVLFSAIQFAFDCNEQVSANRKVETSRQMNEYQSVIEGDRSNSFRYEKTGDNTGKSKLKWRKTSLTNVRNTFC